MRSCLRVFQCLTYNFRITGDLPSFLKNQVESLTSHLRFCESQKSSVKLSTASLQNLAEQRNLLMKQMSLVNEQILKYRVSDSKQLTQLYTQSNTCSLLTEGYSVRGDYIVPDYLIILGSLHGLVCNLFYIQYMSIKCRHTVAVILLSVITVSLLWCWIGKVQQLLLTLLLNYSSVIMKLLSNYCNVWVTFCWL